MEAPKNPAEVIRARKGRNKQTTTRAESFCKLETLFLMLEDSGFCTANKKSLVSPTPSSSPIEISSPIDARRYFLYLFLFLSNSGVSTFIFSMKARGEILSPTKVISEGYPS